MELPPLPDLPSLHPRPVSQDLHELLVEFDLASNDEHRDEGYAGGTM